MTQNYTTVSTMQAVQNATTARNELVKSSAPATLLAEIKQGNARYCMGRGTQSGMTLLSRNQLAMGQAPKVMLLSGSDSRVPTEIIFDQGVGDVFVTRNAGNQWGRRVGGTIDYAFNVLGIKLLVVMGHENCGVVQAATRPLAILSNEPPQLAKMLLSVSDKLARSAAEINTFVEGPDRLTAAIIANARAQAAMVVAMPGVAARVETGELMVVHAYYQVSTGKVHFFAPKAPIELPPLPPPRSFLPFCGRGVVDASVLAPGVKTTLKPNQILSEFKEGNARFWTGESAQHTTVQGHNQRLGFAERPGVLPKAMVLGCADSRVPVEMVFDQPVGEIFVARNAGNLHTEHTAGSAEYAVVHLGVKLIVVLGHQACGAVKAAQLPTKDIKGMPENLAFTLLDMKDGLKYCMYTLENMSDPKARDRESVVANAQVQVRKLSAEPGLRAKVHSGELLIVAAVYDLTSGIVDFF